MGVSQGLSFPLHQSSPRISGNTRNSGNTTNLSSLMMRTRIIFNRILPTYPPTFLAGPRPKSTSSLKNDHLAFFFQEDASGLLLPVDVAAAQREKRRRYLEAPAERIRRGMIRYVYILLDLSRVRISASMPAGGGQLEIPLTHTA